jgi:hypothetical protein
MAYERFANGGLSSLTDAIDASVTSLTVKSPVGFPTTGNFRILVENEIMLVSNIQGPVFTVARGQEGTTAAGHDANKSVFHILTAGALAARENDQVGTGGTTWDAAGQAGRLYLPTSGFGGQDNGLAWDLLPLQYMKPPVSTDFAVGWINQGTSTVTISKGMMILTPQAVASGDSLRLLLKAAPTPPYKITVAFVVQSPPYHSQANTAQYGVCWRESSSGKIIVLGPGTQSYPGWIYQTRWTNATTYSAYDLRTSVAWNWPFWIRFGDTGVGGVRSVEISGDGLSWELAKATEDRTTFLTADQVGVFANSCLTTVAPRIVSFLHWSEG